MNGSPDQCQCEGKFVKLEAHGASLGLFLQAKLGTDPEQVIKGGIALRIDPPTRSAGGSASASSGCVGKAKKSGKQASEKQAAKPLDLYALLGVENRAAKKKQLDHAKRLRLLQLHPDKTQKQKQLHDELSKIVLAAYEVLANNNWRQRYDDSGEIPKDCTALQALQKDTTIRAKTLIQLITGGSDKVPVLVGGPEVEELRRDEPQQDDVEDPPSAEGVEFPLATCPERPDGKNIVRWAFNPSLNGNPTPAVLGRQLWIFAEELKLFKEEYGQAIDEGVPVCFARWRRNQEYSSSAKGGADAEGGYLQRQWNKARNHGQLLAGSVSADIASWSRDRGGPTAVQREFFLLQDKLLTAAKAAAVERDRIVGEAVRERLPVFLPAGAGRGEEGRAAGRGGFLDAGPSSRRVVYLPNASGTVSQHCVHVGVEGAGGSGFLVVALDRVSNEEIFGEERGYGYLP